MTLKLIDLASMPLDQLVRCVSWIAIWLAEADLLEALDARRKRRTTPWGSDV